MAETGTVRIHMLWVPTIGLNFTLRVDGLAWVFLALIMGIFLGYGLAIGIVGSLVGFVLAYLIVTNLNEIQYALAERMGTTIAWAALVVLMTVVGAVVGTLLGRRRDTPFVSSWRCSGDGRRSRPRRVR